MMPFRWVWIFPKSIWRVSSNTWSSCYSVLSRIICLQWLV